MDEGGKTFTPWTYEITEGASGAVNGDDPLLGGLNGLFRVGGVYLAL